MPIPSARPEREITFSVIPLKYIQTIVVTILIGIEQAITAVGRISFRKRIRISTASPAPNTMLLMIEFITRSIYTPWSISVTSIRSGFSSISASNFARIRSDTSPVE